MRFRRRDEDGASAVEFALIFLPFSLLLFGIIEFGFYFWTAEMTGSASRETARRIVVGDCWTGYQTFAEDHGARVTSTRLLDPATNTAVAPSSLSVGDPIMVEVTSNAALTNLIPVIPDTVTRAYEARMEDDTNSGTCP